MNKLLKKLASVALMLIGFGGNQLAVALACDLPQTSLSNATLVALNSNTKFEFRQQIPADLRFHKILVVSALNGSMLTAKTTTGESFSVDLSQAKIVRRHGGASSLGEISIGDKLSVFGTRDLKDPMQLKASWVKNLSVYFGRVSGVIQTLSGNQITLAERDVLSATTVLTANTKYAGNEKYTVNTWADLKIGDHVLAEGLKDDAVRTLKTESVKLLTRPAVPETNTGVRGEALIGPTCPVEHFPPLPGCSDKPYVGKLEIFTKAGTFVKEISTNEQGKFETKLEPGIYVISLPGNTTLPRLSPVEVTVKEGQMTRVELMLDSGIR